MGDKGPCSGVWGPGRLSLQRHRGTTGAGLRAGLPVSSLAAVSCPPSSQLSGVRGSAELDSAYLPHACRARVLGRAVPWRTDQEQGPQREAVWFPWASVGPCAEPLGPCKERVRLYPGTPAGQTPGQAAEPRPQAPPPGLPRCTSVGSGWKEGGHFKFWLTSNFNSPREVFQLGEGRWTRGGTLSTCLGPRVPVGGASLDLAKATLNIHSTPGWALAWMPACQADL